MNFRGGFQWGVIVPFRQSVSEYSDGAEYGNWTRRNLPHRLHGHGITQDPIPGTHVGSFDRGINASNINAAITNFNNPSLLERQHLLANVLIQNGLMTQPQLQALGGVL